MHQLIVIYGLIDGHSLLRKLVNVLASEKLRIIHYEIGWSERGKFSEKFEKLLAFIDSLPKNDEI